MTNFCNSATVQHHHHHHQQSKPHKSYQSASRPNSYSNNTDQQQHQVKPTPPPPTTSATGSISPRSNKSKMPPPPPRLATTSNSSRTSSLDATRHRVSRNAMANLSSDQHQDGRRALSTSSGKRMANNGGGGGGYPTSTDRPGKLNDVNFAAADDAVDDDDDQPRLLQQQQRQLSHQQPLGSQLEVWNSLDELFWDHMREVQNKWSTLKMNDDIWAKLIYFEQNRRLAKAYVSAPVLTIDGSTNGLDGFRIGLSGIDNSYRSLDSIACLRSIGQGIKLKIDGHGNILMRKISSHQDQCSVWVKDWPRARSPALAPPRSTTNIRFSQASSDLSSSSGASNSGGGGGFAGSGQENWSMQEIEETDLSYKIFDMQKFRLKLEERRRLQSVYNQANQRSTATTIAGLDGELLDWRQCVSIISFVRTRVDETKKGPQRILKEPCWLMLINIIAIDMLKSSINCDTTTTTTTTATNPRRTLSALKLQQQQPMAMNNGQGSSNNNNNNIGYQQEMSDYLSPLELQQQQSNQNNVRSSRSSRRPLNVSASDYESTNHIKLLRPSSSAASLFNPKHDFMMAPTTAIYDYQSSITSTTTPISPPELHHKPYRYGGNRLPLNHTRRYQSAQDLMVKNDPNNLIYTTFTGKYTMNNNLNSTRNPDSSWKGNKNYLADYSSTSDYNSASRTSTNGSSQYGSNQLYPLESLAKSNQRILPFVKQYDKIKGKSLSNSSINKLTINQQQFKPIDLRLLKPSSSIKMNFDEDTEGLELEDDNEDQLRRHHHHHHLDLEEDEEEDNGRAVNGKQRNVVRFPMQQNTSPSSRRAILSLNKNIKSSNWTYSSNNNHGGTPQRGAGYKDCDPSESTNGKLKNIRHYHHHHHQVKQRAQDPSPPGVINEEEDDEHLVSVVEPTKNISSNNNNNHHHQGQDDTASLLQQKKASRSSINSTASSSSSSGCPENDYFISQSSSSMTSSTTSSSQECELFSQPASSSGIVCSGHTSDEYELVKAPSKIPATGTTATTTVKASAADTEEQLNSTKVPIKTKINQGSNVKKSASEQENSNSRTDRPAGRNIRSISRDRCHNVKRVEIEEDICDHYEQCDCSLEVPCNCCCDCGLADCDQGPNYRASRVNLAAVEANVGEMNRCQCGLLDCHEQQQQQPRADQSIYERLPRPSSRRRSTPNGSNTALAGLDGGQQNISESFEDDVITPIPLDLKQQTNNNNNNNSNSNKPGKHDKGWLEGRKYIRLFPKFMFGSNSNNNTLNGVNSNNINKSGTSKTPSKHFRRTQSSQNLKQNSK